MIDQLINLLSLQYIFPLLCQNQFFIILKAFKQMGNKIDYTANQMLMMAHKDIHQEFIKTKKSVSINDIKFPLSTNSSTIVDQNNKRVKLSGTNWSGGHMCRHTVDGLQCQPLRKIAKDIREKFKMNCIRLTYSLQLFYDNNIIPEKYLKANPDLIGKTAMEIFDKTVQILTQEGLMVILNNHTSSSQWCCSNDDGDGLWWSRKYPQYMFFQCAEAFAKRYSKNQRVIGMDLRNELRKANGLQATWGTNDPKTDWKRAAKICAQKVLKIAPHWLIFVSGLNYQLDLSRIGQSPLQLSIPNKLVYTGHFYSFSWPVPSWSVYSYERFKKQFFNSQTFVRALGVPYLLGQFGNNKRDIPWNYLIKYLQQSDIDWTYWCCDGFKCEPQKDQTYGLFSNDFSQIRNPQIYEDLMKIVHFTKQQFVSNKK